MHGLADAYIREIQSNIELGFLSPDQVHESILNQYSKLIQVFRKQAGDKPFEHIFAAGNPEQPLRHGFQEKDLDRAVGDLSKNLRSLKQKLLSPIRGVNETLERVKAQVIHHMDQGLNAQNEWLQDAFRVLDEAFREEQQSMRTQIEDLNKQLEVLQLRVLGKEEFEDAMRKQTEQIL